MKETPDLQQLVIEKSIRNYFIKALSIAGIVATIFGIFLSYLVKQAADNAVKEASYKAYDVLEGKTIELAMEIQQHQNRVESFEQTERELEKTYKVLKENPRIADKIMQLIQEYAADPNAFEIGREIGSQVRIQSGNQRITGSPVSTFTGWVPFPPKYFEDRKIKVVVGVSEVSWYRVGKAADLQYVVEVTEPSTNGFNYHIKDIRGDLGSISFFWIAYSY